MLTINMQYALQEFINSYKCIINGLIKFFIGVEIAWITLKSYSVTRELPRLACYGATD